MKRKRVVKIGIIIIVLNLFLVGCRIKKSEKIEDINIQMIMDMNPDELKKVQGKGKEIIKDGKTMSITYEGELFGISKVQSTYHFFEDRDKISGVKVYFPKKTDIDILIKNISKELGKPNVEKKDENYKEHFVEWQTDNIYYTLNNYKKVENGDLLELTIIVLP